MKKWQQRSFRVGIIVLCLWVSLVFLTSFKVKTEGTLPFQPVVGTPAERVKNSIEETEKPKEEVPPMIVDHPLPKEPVAVITPMASAHFALWEYACDCPGYCDGFPAEMDPVLLEKVEALRCLFDRPIIITSGVRCPQRNAEVGGIEESWHLRGHAADLYCPGISYTELAEGARSLGLGVIEYLDRRFDHVEIWQ
ncbi:MAG: D-Ala-D-Ala carboxypeptidase family metallohydrolase [Eubacterium sp.]